VHLVFREHAFYSSVLIQALERLLIGAPVGRKGASPGRPLASRGIMNGHCDRIAFLAISPIKLDSGSVLLICFAAEMEVVWSCDCNEGD
jgi:hypothetical protein